MPRRVSYRVATSLDGYIAGPNGEIDWIVPDPSVDFDEVYSAFDTVLLGRRTYRMTQQPGAPPWPKGWRVYVFSRTLDQRQHPDVTVVSTDVEETVRRLRNESGRDIWLFGGASLFASLLNANVVDEVGLSVMPVLLGAGMPLAGPDAPRARLSLVKSSTSANGIVHLTYSIG